MGLTGPVGGKVPMARLLRAHLYGGCVVGLYIVLLPHLLRRLDLRVGAPLPAACWYAGALVFTLGTALAYLSFWILTAEGGGTAFPTDPPHRLLIDGPYRFVRNPMYLGNLAMILGVALLLRSPVVLGYVLVMGTLTHLYVTRSEEPALLRRYGRDYRTYLHTTPRWVPCVGR